MSCLLAVAEFMWESRKLVMDREVINSFILIPLIISKLVIAKSGNGNSKIMVNNYFCSNRLGLPLPPN